MPYPGAAAAQAAAQGSPTVGSAKGAATSHASIAAALSPRRYHTRVGHIPPYPPHPRPSQKAPPSKRGRTSGLGESSSSRPQEPKSPTNQSSSRALPMDLSPASIIRRPYLHCSPILGNTDCNARDLHDEVHYDLLAFFEDPELHDSMRLVQRYSVEPFMTPRWFFYPWVVIEFYQKMTSRQEPNPTTIYFTIDGRPGILQASDIEATFNLPVVLANSVDYRKWPHPSTMDMVRLSWGNRQWPYDVHPPLGKGPRACYDR